jgi:hypothetical protein
LGFDGVTVPRISVAEAECFDSGRQKENVDNDRGGHGDEEGGAVYEDVSHLSVVDRAQEKIYPTNYVDAEATNVSKDEDNQAQNVYYVQAEEEDALNVENLECMALNGDEDALLIQQFERNFEDMMQNIPELQSALLSHQEARQRISKRRRSRGFWPSRCCKSGKDQGKWFRKGGPRSSKDELLARI